MSTDLDVADPRLAEPVEDIPMRREVIPPAILLTGAILFALAVHGAHITTWTGPGFSMFSSSDYVATRVVLISVTTKAGSGPATAPEDLEAALSRQRWQPNEDALQQTAADLLDLKWSRQDDGSFSAGNGDAADMVELRLITVHIEGERVMMRTIVEAEASK